MHTGFMGMGSQPQTIQANKSIDVSQSVSQSNEWMNRHTAMDKTINWTHNSPELGGLVVSKR
jgi:hypothetical protein